MVGTVYIVSCTPLWKNKLSSLMMSSWAVRRSETSSERRVYFSRAVYMTWYWMRCWPRAPTPNLRIAGKRPNRAQRGEAFSRQSEDLEEGLWASTESDIRAWTMSRQANCLCPRYTKPTIPTQRFMICTPWPKWSWLGRRLISCMSGILYTVNDWDKISQQKYEIVSAFQGHNTTH